MPGSRRLEASSNCSLSRLQHSLTSGSLQMPVFRFDPKTSLLLRSSRSKPGHSKLRSLSP